jgi:PPOX class probable F420-dependent enzyme
MVTMNPDGTPQVTVVWVGLEGEEIVSAHLFPNRKVRNVQRDPRVVISLEATGTSGPDLRNYLVVHARARIEEGGAPELLERLGRVYLGPDVKFPPMEDPPPGYVMRMTPERVGGMGPWAGGG